MYSLVSSQAKPNIKPWSPAPCSLKSPCPSVTPAEMSGDWRSIAVTTAQVSTLNPVSGEVYPISRMTRLATSPNSHRPWLVISPATTTIPVLMSASQATRLSGSCARSESRIASEIWSHTLSGWPSLTDSELNTKSLSIAAKPPADLTRSEEHTSELQSLRHLVCRLL